jgi:hypothetical protein
LDSIKDEGIRAQFGEATIGGHVFETLKGILVGITATDFFREWITVMINDAAYEEPRIFFQQHVIKMIGPIMSATLRIAEKIKISRGLVTSTFVAL